MRLRNRLLLPNSVCIPMGDYSPCCCVPNSLVPQIRTELLLLQWPSIEQMQYPGTDPHRLFHGRPSSSASSSPGRRMPGCGMSLQGHSPITAADLMLSVDLGARSLIFNNPIDNLFYGGAHSWRHRPNRWCDWVTCNLTHISWTPPARPHPRHRAAALE